MITIIGLWIISLECSSPLQSITWILHCFSGGKPDVDILYYLFWLVERQYNFRFQISKRLNRRHFGSSLNLLFISLLDHSRDIFHNSMLWPISRSVPSYTWSIGQVSHVRHIPRDAAFQVESPSPCISQSQILQELTAEVGSKPVDEARNAAV